MDTIQRYLFRQHSKFKLNQLFAGKHIEDTEE